MPPNLDDCIHFLVAAGADAKKHSGRTLLTHLKRTHATLEAATQPETICIAGLFHSVYGTSNFASVTVEHSQRAEVKHLIGEEAERLAWLFGRLDRPRALKAFITGDGDVTTRDGAVLDRVAHQADLNACAIIEAANLLDQQQLWRHSWLHRTASQAGIVTPTGNSVLREQPHAVREIDFAVMFEFSKEQLRVELAEKINAIRRSTSSRYEFSDLLRRVKLAQAQQLASLSADRMTDEVLASDYALVTNYAHAYGMTATDAAASILASASREQQLLFETEILRDRIGGEIHRCESIENIDRIRTEIRALDQKAIRSLDRPQQQPATVDSASVQLPPLQEV